MSSCAWLTAARGLERFLIHQALVAKKAQVGQNCCSPRSLCHSRWGCTVGSASQLNLLQRATFLAAQPSSALNLPRPSTFLGRQLSSKLKLPQTPPSLGRQPSAQPSPPLNLSRTPTLIAPTLHGRQTSSAPTVTVYNFFHLTVVLAQDQLVS